MAKAKQEVAVPENSSLPAYLQGHTGGSGLQGLTSEDFVIPRIKLLQAISPEVEAHENAKAGIFWLNVLDQPLGETLRFIVCSNKKRVLLMAPREDGRGILARADDGIHWNNKGEWDVKIKGVRGTVKWTIDADTVRESGLLEYGSSNPDDQDSNPAATLFYEYLVFLPDFPEISPVLLSLSRSQAKKAKDLNGKIEFRKAPMQSQVFQASIAKESSQAGDFLNYNFASSGWASEEDYRTCTAITERFKDYRGADEESAAREEGASAATSGDY